MDCDLSLELDLRVGGLGDNWMRLVALFSASYLVPTVAVSVVLPDALAELGAHFLEGRATVVGEAGKHAISYTTRGLRDLALPSLLQGKRYAAPYARVVMHDRKRWTMKDRLNDMGYQLFDQLGLVGVPPWSAISRYQAYLELVTLATFRDVGHDAFINQAAKDYPLMHARLSEEVPTSVELSIPDYLGTKVLVFPSGTARQSMPPAWAQTFFPNAVYAFFHKDREMARFEQAGLATVPFYTRAGDILALARRARAVLTVDSFPSHLLQYGLPHKTTILLTELRRERVVSPFFEGAVVDSSAPCHPCLHIAKGTNTRCQAGHIECVNWSSVDYGLDAQLKVAGLMHELSA